METTEQVFIVEYIDKKKKVCVCSPLHLKKQVLLKGKTPQNTGVAIKAFGYFENSSKKVFFCDSWVYEKIPKNDVFLAYAKTFKGIGASKAKKILADFGTDYSVFSNPEIMQLYSKKYPEIVAKAKKDNEYIIDTQLMEKLATFGVIKKNKIKKICQTINYSRFIENPFILMSLPGVNIPFKTCNSIVIQMQKEKPGLLKSDSRILNGIEYVLRQNLSHGHTYIIADELIKKVKTFLNDGVILKKNYISENMIKQQMNILNKTHKIKAEKNANELRIYDAFYYDCENFIAKELYRKISSKQKKVPQERIIEEIDKYDKTSKFKLADSQRLAIETIVNNPVAIITGSAGTGKTTVLKAAIQVLNNLGQKKITLSAPTGRAARKMAEATGLEASTLHSLLRLGIEDEDADAVDVYMNEEKIDTDVIFVDETSMCDIGIIYRLFQKINSKTRIYFIGDPHQLESVGSGNVLADMIDSCCVPVVKLKFIYRQAKDSNIIMNANKILNGKYNLTTGKDFEILNIFDPEKISQKIAEIYVSEIKRLGNVLDVQCICPMRQNGILATNQLNKIIQNAVNPTKKSQCFKANGFCFFEGDKVICSKNTKTVRNGDIGIVTSSENGILKVTFETGEEIFTTDEAVELGIMLAYCITVHKAQGSEFKTTIMPIAEENEKMLKRNLFYTAVTRAKEKMILVGDKTQIEKAIFNNKIIKRNGLLKARIRKEFNV